MITAIIPSNPSDVAGPGYILAPDTVLLLVQDGTGRLLDFDGHFYALSDTAAMMLAKTLEAGPAAALEQIITTFDAARAAAHRDLEALLTGLIARGILLKRTKGQRRRAPNRGGTALPGASSVARILALLQASSRLPVSVLLAFAYASVRLFGWSHTVMSWQVCFPSVAASAPANADAARAADAAIRETAALHPLNITCKERALACWALLHAGGWPAELVLGVDLFPLASHAWCESSGLLLTDYEDRCRRFTPVLRYA